MHHNSMVNLKIILSCISLISFLLLLSASVSAYTSFSGWCYQESANTSNQAGTDGSCGLNYGGAYSWTAGWGSPENVTDGNWDTYTGGSTGSYFYINYTKPTNYQNSSLWQIKYYGAGGTPVNATVNISILNSCWTYNSTTIFLQVYTVSGQLDFYCKNASNWQFIGGDGWKIYEEAMWWNITGGTTYSCSPPAASQGNGVWDINCSQNCSWYNKQKIPSNITITGKGSLHLNAYWLFTTIKKHTITIDNGCRLLIGRRGGFR